MTDRGSVAKPALNECVDLLSLTEQACADRFRKSPHPIKSETRSKSSRAPRGKRGFATERLALYDHSQGEVAEVAFSKRASDMPFDHRVLEPLPNPESDGEGAHRAS